MVRRLRLFGVLAIVAWYACWVVVANRKQQRQRVDSKVDGAKRSSTSTLVPHNNHNNTPSLHRFLDRATGLHLGKGGGGSIYSGVIKSFWSLNFGRCHPFPCPDKVSHPPHGDHGVLINVRDPIDRFVSSFYWVLTIACHPGMEEKRIVLSKASAVVANRTDTHCLRVGQGNTKAFDAYHHIYEQDINLFAAALCSENKVVRAKAAGDHCKWNQHGSSLADWLPFLLDNNNSSQVSAISQAVFPIVLEKDVVDLIDQSNRAVEWLQNVTQFEDEAAFSRRRQWAEQKQKESRSGAAIKTVHHSSTFPRVPLSAASERCLALHFRKDYELVLPRIQAELCKTDDCRKGIQSILDRRRPSLLAARERSQKSRFVLNNG